MAAVCDIVWFYLGDFLLFGRANRTAERFALAFGSGMIPWVGQQKILNDEELTLVLFTASFLAAEEKSNITLSIFFTALYISSYERLRMFSNNWKGIIRFIKYDCGLENPTWLYWMRIHEVLDSGKSHGLFIVEPEVNNLLEMASENVLARHGQVVSVADVLHAISNHQGIELCKNLSQPVLI